FSSEEKGGRERRVRPQRRRRRHIPRGSCMDFPGRQRPRAAPGLRAPTRTNGGTDASPAFPRRQEKQQGASGGQEERRRRRRNGWRGGQGATRKRQG
ncbi:unnamed protein product, partial [Ectocarpus sp. 8 AP-2014]